MAQPKARPAPRASARCNSFSPTLSADNRLSHRSPRPMYGPLHADGWLTRVALSGAGPRGSGPLALGIRLPPAREHDGDALRAGVSRRAARGQPLPRTDRPFCARRAAPPSRPPRSSAASAMPTPCAGPPVRAAAPPPPPRPTAMSPSGARQLLGLRAEGCSCGACMCKLHVRVSEYACVLAW